MKGPNYQEELSETTNGLEKLGGELDTIEEFEIINAKRSIIIIKKIKATEKKYPRKPGMPAKSPIK